MIVMVLHSYVMFLFTMSLYAAGLIVDLFDNMLCLFVQR